MQASVAMEDWQKEFKWLETKHKIASSLGKGDQTPDFYTILYLIGLQELGQIPDDKFSKEEKQDLMHIAICTLLEGEFYEFKGIDQDGWPHWISIKPFEIKGINEQEEFLKEKVIAYFDKIFE